LKENHEGGRDGGTENKKQTKYKYKGRKLINNGIRWCRNVLIMDYERILNKF
jgi:hypothetical protein